MNLFGNSIWQLIYQSDRVTWCVLLILLFLSIICWSLFFYKLIIWKNKKKNLQEIMYHLKNVNEFENLVFIASKLSDSIGGFFLSKNLTQMKPLIDVKDKCALSDREWNVLQNNIENSIDEIMQEEESKLPIFSVSAAISPLLGLFGTVWGLVHSFIDISQKQSADIATVAPGLAEALITTLAGLMIAIPSLTMYYILKMKSESLERQLFLLSEKFLNIIQKNFNKTMEIKCVYTDEKKETSLQK